MSRLILPAPAKLNLFLHITGRRSDGYHELQTLFQLLDRGDELGFEVREDGALRLHTAFLETPPGDNLVIRAAQRLREHTGCRLGADIHLDKRLPTGGGLGGGSSDAATTLLGLNRLWKLGLTIEELAGLGLSLGADVPVFVHGFTAWGEGIGERLQPVELPEVWYLVITPDCQVSTAAIFGHRELTRNARPITIRAFLEKGLEKGPETGLEWEVENVCQPIVERLYPAVKSARKWLQNRAPTRMTGTGASVFGTFGSEADALASLRDKPAAWRGFVAKGVNRSPLHSLLQRDRETTATGVSPSG